MSSEGLPARRILVVDDDEDIAEVARLALTAVGRWEVEVANSGAAAIEAAARRLPDAVLLDMMMPDLDGRATAELLGGRDDTAAIPIILLTAKLRAGQDPALRHQRVAGVITKPFDPMQLSADVARLLGWSR